jgi:hypothetical protein
MGEDITMIDPTLIAVFAWGPIVLLAFLAYILLVLR